MRERAGEETKRERESRFLTAHQHKTMLFAAAIACTAFAMPLSWVYLFSETKRRLQYIHLYSPERQQQQVKEAPNTQPGECGHHPVRVRHRRQWTYRTSATVHDMHVTHSLCVTPVCLSVCLSVTLVVKRVQVAKHDPFVKNTSRTRLTINTAQNVQCWACWLYMLTINTVEPSNTPTIIISA